MDGQHYLENMKFNVERMDNDTFLITSIHSKKKPDDTGALYYVIVVILIYGCSILMMIASYIRKNKMDRKLNRYLKEMANVRKRERQFQLITAAAKAREHRESLAGHVVASVKLSNTSQCSDISEETEGQTDKSKKQEPLTLEGDPGPSQQRGNSSSPPPTPGSEWECSSISDISTSKGSGNQGTAAPHKKRKHKVRILTMPHFITWNKSPRFGRKKFLQYESQKREYLQISGVQDTDSNNDPEQGNFDGYQVVSTV